MTIQAVFFDMGGTIETFGWTLELRMKATPGIRKLLENAGIVLDLSDKQLYEIITLGLKDYHNWSLISQDELPPARVWSDYILAGYSFDREKLVAIAEDLMLYIETHYYERSMRPEVPAVLDAVRKMGFKIGIISNVNSRGQVPVSLTQYGIRHYFDPIVLSSEYGCRKPDPAIFHHAAWLADVPTSHCVYIGDRIARDILGAKRAGFKLAVQIIHDYDHGEADYGAMPDAVINRMSELVHILKAEQEKGAHSGTLEGVRAVVFDAGDILYHRPNRHRRLAKFLAECGIEFNGVDRNKTRLLDDRAFCGLISRDQYREAILRLYGITRSDQLEKGIRILDEDDSDVTFFTSVPETLHELKKNGYLLGIITDTAAPISDKLNWFERGGFGDVWDSIISSKEMGIRKPDLRMFQASLRQLGVPADQVVFVGHKACELDGAKIAGMLTVAFNYEKDAKADFYIERFSDLLELPVMCESVSVRHI